MMRLMHTAFSAQVPAVTSRGSWPPSAHLGAFTGPSRWPHKQNKGGPILPTDGPRPSPSAWRRPFSLPSQPSTLLPPSSPLPLTALPPTGGFFLQQKSRKPPPHTSSTHSFLQGLTHTQFSLIWSSLFSVPWETPTLPFISGSTG